ncbi:ImmA/IrrE family metallo-endopeptidase [Ruegeria sp. XHP0148]|uniref:ImmA/IrrE family metallo-endopeptidase n=1 Tax=Ruegeria aquimaris TaxID=2984333 RepID=A0ABT3ATF5_9RHOB|nr:ImmA/IrrE family metallo-endopeptidase [Ruegeria sp. XHP0148]
MRPGEQGDLFGRSETDDQDPDRALIDQLIADTQLYSTSSALKELFDFTARMKNMAPFNAMLLHAQKPGISYAMTVQDWWGRFRRRPKEGARPLIILRNFGPVNFVYDVLDTEGEELPEAAFSFPTTGKLPFGFLRACEHAMAGEDLRLIWLDQGDRSAGFARRITNHGDPKKLQTFEVGVNRNHPEPTQVVTLVHELAHIFLGHCGPDFRRKIKHYRPVDLALREIEAESVAYVVAKRSGLAPRSESYLDSYKGASGDLDVHRVLSSAYRIEKLLGMPLEGGGSPQ